MTNWALPSVTSLYTNFVTEVSNRDISCARWFNSATVADTNIPTGTIRWNNTNKNWEEWSGSTWGALTATYGISITGYSTNIAGGNSTTLLGSIPYQSNTNITTLLSPNVTTTKKILTQTGTGTNGAAPTWSVLSVGDISGAAPLASPTFSGTPSLPTGTTGVTQTVGDNSTKLATTAFVLANGTSLSDGTPLVNGTAAAGNGTSASRWNHVHPTDTSRAATGQTFYIGTTQVAINRGSGALTLNGVSVSGSSGSCTGNAATATYATSAGSTADATNLLLSAGTVGDHQSITGTITHSLNTSYLNSYGKSIIISAKAFPTATHSGYLSGQISPNGSTWTSVVVSEYISTTYWVSGAHITFVVPAGYYYKVINTTACYFRTFSIER